MSNDDNQPVPPDHTGPDARTRAESRAAALGRVAAEDRSRRRRKGALQALAVVAVTALVLGGVVLALQSQDDSAGTASAPSGSTPSAVNADGAFTVGNPDAPVTVQVVEDFQCPICQQFESVAGDLLAEYAAGDDVKVEYRGIAFLDRASTTNYSSRALNASACVMDSGVDVWTEFHRQLYVQQPAEGGAGLPDDALLSIAGDAEADEDAITSCIEDQQYADWVAATTSAAFDDGVTGTPTLFVNGEQLDGFDPATLQAAVDEALAS